MVEGVLESLWTHYTDNEYLQGQAYTPTHTQIYITTIVLRLASV